MHSHISKQHLTRALEEHRVVVLLAPHKLGKTTSILKIAKSRPCVYVDLKKSHHLKKLTHHNPDQLMIIDHLESQPQLPAGIKDLLLSQKSRRFLLVSARSQNLIRKQLSFFKTKIKYLPFSCLSALDIEERYDKPLRKLWLRGGFPKSYLAEDDHKSYRFRKTLLRNYQKNIIPPLMKELSEETLRNLWGVTAHSHGHSWKMKRLTDVMDLPESTFHKFQSVMEDLLLIRKLPAWQGKTDKDLVSSPRIYFRDSGLLNAWLGNKTYIDLMGDFVFRKHWEGFALEQIISHLPDTVKIFYYEEKIGDEIPLLLQFSEHELWGLAIHKSHIPPNEFGLESFYRACQEVKTTRKFVIHIKNHVFTRSMQTMALPLADFLETLRDYVDPQKETPKILNFYSKAS